MQTVIVGDNDCLCIKHWDWQGVDFYCVLAFSRLVCVDIKQIWHGGADGLQQAWGRRGVAQSGRRSLRMCRDLVKRENGA